MRTRVLPSEEWDRIEAEDFRAFLRTINPEDVAVLVAENDEGRIVGRLAVLKATHLEGYWRAPDAQSGTRRALLGAALHQAAEWSRDWFYVNTDPSNDSTLGPVLQRLGGTWEPIHTYVLPAQRVRMEEAACPQQ